MAGGGTLLLGESTGKGTVVVFKSEDTKAISAGDIVNIPGFFDGSSGQNNVYLIDFNAANAERFALMPCFGKQTHVFAYGHDMASSRSSCTVLVFMGTSQCKPGNNTAAVSKLTEWYKQNRLSEAGGRRGFTLCGDSGFAAGYVIGMQVRAYSPELNAAAVTVTFMTAPPV